MAPPDLLPLSEIRCRVDRTVGLSPADSTAIAWLEVRREAICEGGRPRPGAPGFERTILIRVREKGRVGECRLGSGEPADLDAALRLAIAGSRLAARAAPRGGEPVELDLSAGERALPVLFDAEIAALTPEAAKARLEPHLGRREMVDLDWALGRMVVGGNLATSLDLEASAVALQVRCGRGAGAGSAEGASRSLAALPLETLLARARDSEATSGLAELPGTGPALLSSRAVCGLLEGLAGALAAWGGDSRWAASWRAALAAAGLDWIDDPWTGGLPFPWGLFGRTRVARSILPATEEPSRLAEDEPVGRNHHLRSGSAKSETELLAHAAGGLWIGMIDAVEPVEPLRPASAAGGGLRWVGRGMRRISEAGVLGAPVPDARFEVDPASWLGSLRGCGGEVGSRAAGDRLWGAFSAPVLAFSRLAGGRPLPR